MKCEKCGTTMEVMNEGSGIAIKCPKCGWNMATTTSPAIVQDETDYFVYICGSYKTSTERLKVVSEILGGNYLEAKRYLSGEIKTALVHGEALRIKRAARLLKTAKINYRITPTFPYDLEDHSDDDYRI